MSSRRSSRGNISEDEINELISKLQALLPSSRRRGSGQVRGRTDPFTSHSSHYSMPQLLFDARTAAALTPHHAASCREIHTHSYSDVVSQLAEAVGGCARLFSFILCLFN
jgi:hypothetical protein